MNEEKSNIPDNLRHKFPGLRPVKRKPPLITVNGIGFTLYGNRDYDSESNTYVKTHCFCFIFVPLIALGAYRVADAERGWYFIGKDRLSSFAKSCNAGFLGLSLMLAAIIYEHAYKTSPEYLAGMDLKQAAVELNAGKTLEAARHYREVAEGQSRAQEGRKGLGEALERCLASETPANVEAGLRLLAALPQRLNLPTPIVPDAGSRGLALVDKFRPKNPEAALEILRAAGDLVGATNANLKPLEIELLRETLAANPGETKRVVELALIYEEQRQMPECFKLLAPYQNKLGATEGARILGEHLLAEGDYEDAYALLFPYVQTNLNRLHALERDYTNAVNGAYHRAIERLNQKGADASFYVEYKNGSQAEKDKLVEAYVAKFMRTDGPLQQAEQELRSASKFVNVTLDLGIVQLSRAQRLSEPAARKQELEAAENTLLSVRGVAGGSDAYRMHLGQVYYWLGKPKEGKELFDRLLETHHRDFWVLMSIAGTLREVGEAGQTRQLLEDAYRGAKTDEERFKAAGMRARTFENTDDEIIWLKKCDPAAPAVQIDLNGAQGSKALQDENRELAAQFFRKAIAGYDDLPRNAITLNNCGLVYLELFHATGKVEDYTRGLGMFELAVALAPGDSMLLNNFTHLLVPRAYMDAVGSEINFEAIKDSPDLEMLQNLYQDEVGWEEVYGRLQSSAYMKKALSYLDKALLLMPKSASLYQFGLHLQGISPDLVELQKLQQRLETASPDLAELLRETKEGYTAGKDKQRLERLQKDIQRYEQALATDAVKGHPLTLAAAENKRNEISLYVSMYGGQVDSREILGKAQAVYQRQPSAASRSVLLSALFLRAHEELKQQNADYARQAELTRRTLPPRDLISFVAERNAAVASLVSTNPDLLKAAELLKEKFRLMPRQRDIADWSLFRILEPGIADDILSRLKQDLAGRLMDQLQFRLNPGVATYVLEQYWTSQMNKDDTAASQIYQQAVKDGVPLPAL